MAETLTLLLTAWFLAGFIFESDRITPYHRRWWAPACHAALVAGFAAILIGGTDGLMLGVLFAIPLLTGILKSRLSEQWIKNWRAFLADHLFHGLVMLILAMVRPDALTTGWWSDILDETRRSLVLTGAVFTTGTLLCIPVGGQLIGLLTGPLTLELGDNAAKEGLFRGGRYIGYLERAFVMMLVLAGQMGGIGFVVAAKSVLRFGDIKDAASRKTAEYIIIGTFLSFGWGMAVSLLLVQALAYWKP